MVTDVCTPDHPFVRGEERSDGCVRACCSVASLLCSVVCSALLCSSALLSALLSFSSVCNGGQRRGPEVETHTSETSFARAHRCAPLPARSCLGAPDHAEGCLAGTAGTFCSECQPGYSKKGTGKCALCLEARTQNLIFAGGILVALLIVGVLIRNTLKARGNPSDIKVGIIKVGMRHFQLAAMAVSFPLHWPDELKTLFNAMGTASSAGDVSLEQSESNNATVHNGTRETNRSTVRTRPSLFSSPRALGRRRLPSTASSKPQVACSSQRR